MSYFSPLRREIDRLVAEFRRRVPKFSNLPFLVYKVDWSVGEGETPGHEEWSEMLQGKKPLSDVQGYEGHNQAAEAQARETGIHPKFYLFDADGEFGCDP